MKNNKGFTLIELLVVISIIGLLSTLAVVSLNDARAKSRDARRLSDVKQLSTILEMQATEGTSYAAIENCAAGINTASCTGPGQVSQFLDFTDPSNPTDMCKSTTVNETCQYSIAATNGTGIANMGDYQICFYLEATAATLSQGLHAITTGGRFEDCTIQ